MSSPEFYMGRALELAERGRGQTAPNPCVGAVLVRQDAIVAQGWHHKCGGPHAEINCLADARDKGVNPAECTLYVTLEPCNHHGKTPPCTKAVLEAGIPKVVVGAPDPNPNVGGGGIQTLRERRVEVVAGVLETQCRDAIADFVVWATTKRPYVLLKLAQTLDGKIAGPESKPEPVSGPESHCRVHRLRGQADAVLVGGGTLRADDPRLTCRLDPQSGGADELPAVKTPLAVVLTRTLSGLDESFLATKRAAELVVLTSASTADSPAGVSLAEHGCRVWGLPERANGGLDLAEGLTRLRQDQNVYTVLCEGGGTLAASLLDQHLADELRIFLAPRVLGDDRAPSSFSGRSVESLAQSCGLRFAGWRASGEDLELTLRPRTES